MSIVIEGKKYTRFKDMIEDNNFYAAYLSREYSNDRKKILKKFREFKDNIRDSDFIRSLWIKEKITGLPSCKQVGFGGVEAYELNKTKLDKILYIVSTNGNTENCYSQCLDILEKLRLDGKIARIPHVLLNRIFIGFYPNEHVDWVSYGDIRKCYKKFKEFEDFKSDSTSMENERKWFNISKHIRAIANSLGRVRNADYVRHIISLVFRELKRSAPGENDELPPPKDIDEKSWQQILTRRGQCKFRKKLISKYKCCCITGCDDLDALEAAHIQPHSEKENYSLENGLLLRSDIHTLFDLNLIGIDGYGLIHVSKKLNSYGEYKSRKVTPSLDYKTKSNLKIRFLKFKGA